MLGAIDDGNSHVLSGDEKFGCGMAADFPCSREHSLTITSSQRYVFINDRLPQGVSIDPPHTGTQIIRPLLFLLSCFVCAVLQLVFALWLDPRFFFQNIFC